MAPSQTGASPAGRSAGPSPAATADLETTAPIAAVQPRVAVRVVVSELNIRQGPSTSTDVRRVVKRGAVFLIFGFAPIKADGYTWWFTDEIVTVDGGLPGLPTNPGLVDGGYIAVESSERPYVEVLPARCPVSADLLSLTGMFAGEHLACFGDRPLTLEGVYGCPMCGDFDPVNYRPAWLAHPAIHAMWAGGYRASPRFSVHLPDSISEPQPGSIVRVTGHFDDDRSSSCEIVPGEAVPLPPATQAEAETWCRQHFVFDRYEILGTDPDFPPNG